jgi:uncharacterized protein (TIGR00369 family)
MNEQSLQSAGWTSIDADGFSTAVGTLWTRGAGAELIVGFVADERHTNHQAGTVHGGALMTFADVAFGFGVVKALGGTNCATAQLQLQFIAAGKTGEFITCRPEIIRRTSQLVFVRGLITADDRVVASADGIWKVLAPRAG